MSNEKASDRIQLAIILTLMVAFVVALVTRNDGDQQPKKPPSAAYSGRRELPKWRCHKTVWAIKLSEVRPVDQGESDGDAVLTPVDTTYDLIVVDGGYVRRHKPEAGGYYVVYPDGYRSYSPAKPFEDGYMPE